MSRDEVLHSIKWMRSVKSSGLDGLSSELYKEVQDIDPLLNMFNDSFEMSFLPMSSGETNISLILRKDEQPEDWAFYGPLSLLNLDLKLLSKILAGGFTSLAYKGGSNWKLCFSSVVNRWPSYFTLCREGFRQCWIAISVPHFMTWYLRQTVY